MMARRRSGLEIKDVAAITRRKTGSNMQFLCVVHCYQEHSSGMAVTRIDKSGGNHEKLKRTEMYECQRNEEKPRKVF